MQGARLIQPTNDAAQLAALHASCFTGKRSWTKNEFISLLNDKHVTALICMSDDTPSGFIVARHMGKEAEVLTLAVTPKMRRQGIARELLEHMEAHIKHLDAAQIWLEVGADNTPACALYDHSGFNTCGTRPAYYHHTDHRREDALLLVKGI